MEVKRLKNYINGQWVESKTSKWLEVKNPATDEVIALCPETTTGGDRSDRQGCPGCLLDWRSDSASAARKASLRFS